MEHAPHDGRSTLASKHHCRGEKRGEREKKRHDIKREKKRERDKPRYSDVLIVTSGQAAFSERF